MADPRFFEVAGPFSLAEIAAMAPAEPGPGADPDARMTDVKPLDAAGPQDVSFLDNRRYIDQFAASRAGACLVHPDFAGQAPEGMAVLLTAEPYRAYARVARAFYPQPAAASGVHAAAHVHETARVAGDSRIEVGAVVGASAEIGSRCLVSANAVIGAGVVLGEDCVIGPGALLAYCLIGKRVVIHAGARIGQDGFGFAPGADGHLKVPQIGRVIIEDDVEIGANTTIDRGAGPDTVIGAGTKIDNLVQIGHNVRLGRGCIVVSQAGVSGSTHVGNGVLMAGQAGLVGHLRIGDGARIGAQCGVMRDVERGETVIGSPAVPVRQFWRQVAALTRLVGNGRGK